MSGERTAGLSEQLQASRQRWVEADPKDRDRIYAEEFGPAFAPVFADLPLHGAPSGFERPRALVSVLGFSWQPVALMAAWAKPERVLVLTTEDALGRKGAGRPVKDLIPAVAGLSPECFRWRALPEDEIELAIYKEVRDFLDELSRDAQGDWRVAVDPTGGKKSMSAAAALSAFVRNLPLLYVDSVEKLPNTSIPVPGSEYPRFLRNPLDFLGEIEFGACREAFNGGRYQDAEQRASELAGRLFEPREAETLRTLAQAYGHWDAFRFAQAAKHLRRAREELSRFAPLGRWPWASQVQAKLETHVPIAEGLARLQDRGPQAKPANIEEGLPIVLNHLAAATRAWEQGDASRAVMFAYSTVERYCDLLLWCEFGLDDEKPDYGKIADRLDLAAYHAVGRRFHGEGNYSERPLGGPLTYSSSLQQVGALLPDRLPEDVLGDLKTIETLRNRCEYEHGLVVRPPDPKKAERALKAVRRLLEPGAGGPERLAERLRAFEFPVLAG